MVAEIIRMSAGEFEAFAVMPANADKRLELIGGEIVELVSNQEAARLTAKIIIEIGIYLKLHDLGYITSPEGGYHVGDDRYMPDAGYISKARQPTPNKDTYNPLAPDLAVEVISPTDATRDVLTKVAKYQTAGTVVWLFFPDAKETHVYVPNQPARILSVDDTLDGSDILPGFTLPLKNLFED
jgi:Uma2 family endonuclease